MKIIDVSEHQGIIDFKKVKAAGIEGVVIRAGYGKGNPDKYFIRNINGAIKNKLHIGIYWFSYAYTEEMAKAEAAYCHEQIQTYKLNIDMPVFFDWEYDSMRYAEKEGASPDKKLITGMTKTFCEAITKQGYTAGYYMNWDYKRNYYDPEKLKKYKLWFADYEDDYKDCYLQQTAKDGEVNGIATKVDMDILRGKIKTEKPKTTKPKKPAKKPEKKEEYEIGKTYTVDVNSALNVRTGPGTNYMLVGYDGLTPDGKKHATSYGALLPGTKVTCLELAKDTNGNTWMKIPSGWVCAKQGDNTFIK